VRELLIRRPLCTVYTTFCFLLWHSVHEMTILLRLRGGGRAASSAASWPWPADCAESTSTPAGGASSEVVEDICLSTIARCYEMRYENERRPGKRASEWSDTTLSSAVGTALKVEFLLRSIRSKKRLSCLGRKDCRTFDECEVALVSTKHPIELLTLTPGSVGGAHPCNNGPLSPSAFPLRSPGEPG
jgi:hypothetical protein